MNKVKTAIISDSASNWPIYIGLERGIFQKLGLDVELTITNSSKQQLENMEKGVYDIGFAAADHIVKRVVNNNSDLFICMGIALPFYNLITSKEVKNYTELKGKKLGVDGKSSGYALLLEALLEYNNISLSDYEFVEVGGSGKRLKALITGEIDGTFLDAPSDIEAELIGFNRLGSNLDCIPNYQGRIAAVKKSWAKQNEDVLVRFISAYIDAVDWFYDSQNRQETVNILMNKLGLTEEIAENAYERYTKNKIFNEKGMINELGLHEVVKVMQKLGQVKGEVDLSLIHDLSFYSKARG
ncbi:MAG: ABC transporter substrate-binding protein [Bacillota bacterium]